VEETVVVYAIQFNDHVRFEDRYMNMLFSNKMERDEEFEFLINNETETFLEHMSRVKLIIKVEQDESPKAQKIDLNQTLLF
jgi:hypothetical protein